MMPGPPQAPKVSLLRFLIDATGPYGFLLIFFTLVLVLWGLINLCFVKNRVALASQAILSLAPAICACVLLGQLIFPVHRLMSDPAPLEPTSVGQVMVTVLILGIIGTASSVLPALLGILALARNVPAGHDRT